MTRLLRPRAIGWDIGGVNTKAARLDDRGDPAREVPLRDCVAAWLLADELAGTRR